MKVFCVKPNPLQEQLNLIPGVSSFIYPFTCISNSVDPIKIKELLFAVSSEKPDYMFFAKDPQLTRSILLKIKRVSPKTKFVMFYGDQRGKLTPEVMDRLGILNILCINNVDPAQFRMYKKAGIKNVFNLHHATPLSIINFPDIHEDPTMDAFFCGNHFGINKFPLSKFRYNFILKVKKEIKNTTICGKGWGITTEKRVYGNDLIRKVRSSKVNLGINHFNVIRYYDKRLFDCMGAGRLHITYYIPHMERDFENHKHLVWFKTESEGISLIKYYIEHDKERNEIANNGLQRILERHTSYIRALRLVAILKKFS